MILRCEFIRKEALSDPKINESTIKVPNSKPPIKKFKATVEPPKTTETQILIKKDREGKKPKSSYNDSVSLKNTLQNNSCTNKSTKKPSVDHRKSSIKKETRMMTEGFERESESSQKSKLVIKDYLNSRSSIKNRISFQNRFSVLETANAVLNSPIFDLLQIPSSEQSECSFRESNKNRELASYVRSGKSNYKSYDYQIDNIRPVRRTFATVNALQQPITCSSTKTYSNISLSETDSGLDMVPPRQKAINPRESHISSLISYGFTKSALNGPQNK